MAVSAKTVSWNQENRDAKNRADASQPQPAPAKTPAPSVECPICDCPYWWRDIYAGPAGPWRCCACCEPPHESFVSEVADTRRNASGEALSDEGRDYQGFDREWVTTTLVDLQGQAWTVTARRDKYRGQCPTELTLADWSAGLRTKLLTEW